MENLKEYSFKGTVLSGFLMLFVVLALLVIAGLLFAFPLLGDFSYAVAPLCIILSFFLAAGIVMIEPNNLRVMVFFGKYRGTLRANGYFWVNPFYTKTKLTARARNLDIPPIKVNDKNGNPIMIGSILVWRINDTYKCMFEIDSASMVSSTPGQAEPSRMKAFEEFVAIQCDAALRSLAGHYPYDLLDNQKHEVTLRDGGEEVNEELEKAINERLSLAGIEVVEARINYLAYAPEIAAVMLRRQQAEAIIAAREKIVEGAVSMVDMALQRLEEKSVVTFTEERKATMVSNLLVVLCSDEPASPIVNTSGNS
ncbi:MAG: SPFH domain-containing protein [Bacteroidales bacterium]